jgi:predicted nucleotide-binding protein
LSIEFLETDFEKVNYLLSLLISRATGLPAKSSEFEYLRDELLSNSELSDQLPKWLKFHSNLDSFWGFIKPKFSTYAERRTYLSEQFTPVLGQLELEAIPRTSAHPVDLKRSGTTRNKRKVFIVHGRDNEAKQEVARFIENLSLQSIILHEQASSGMTIIEKIEHYSNDADFAIILYTPCDQGRGVHESKEPHKNRARQNVVFEHGYLIAKLGRENICALVKEQIEVPNDISGVVYVPMDGPGAWKAVVEKELQACGYTIS